MRFTMKDVMDIEIMKLGKVRSAIDKLIERPVESISVIEIPVENFVQKNEIVLTTAIGCGEDLTVFKQFVQEVLESGAAGLCVATGYHVSDIPLEVVELAEARQFPIIEIPWEVRFSKITQSILGALNKWMRSESSRSEKLQKQLLNFYLAGNSLIDASDSISFELACPVLIVDKVGVIKGKSQRSDFLQQKWRLHQCGPQSSLHPKHQGIITHSYQNSKTESNRIFLTEDFLFMYKIESGNKLHGYLVFDLPEGMQLEHFLTNGVKQLLEYAVTVLALWFQRENIVFETELRLRDDFVWNLANNEQESWDVVLSRAKSLGYQVEIPYVCIVGTSSNLTLIAEKYKYAHESLDQWVHSAYRLIEKQIEKVSKSIQRRIMVTYHHDRLIIFLEIPMDRIHETINSFLDRADSMLEQVLPGLIMSWGIGENHAGLKMFHKSFHDARIALDIGIQQKGPGHRSTYANTGIYRALMSFSNIPEIQELILSTIGSLIDNDNQRGLDLVHTLMVYIRNQGNVSQTSRALNLHRQSLLYRLRKIEMLTDRSLLDPDDMFLFNLSIKLWTSGLVGR